MKQPELGKKIAELRKAKGLTQDELVEKCNINVRTLQRIEAGEATPRSYTIKIIFAALDYNIYGSSNDIPRRSQKLNLLVSGGLGQSYKYVIDLFNFKTNAMKKIMILSVPSLTLVLVLLFSYSSSVKAQNRMAINAKFEKLASDSKFIQFFNSGAIDSISSQYKEDACIMPDQYASLYDRKSIKDYYTQLYNRGLRFSHLQSTAKILSDSIAIGRGTWSVSINSVVVATGTFLQQWRYENGEWLIENEMSKSDIPN